MLALFKIFQKLILYIYLTEIPISSVFCEAKEVAIKEGWGGKHIIHFPPYNFFRIYISGKQKEAKDSMKQWYYHRLVEEKLCVVAKAKGGMSGGSLFKVLAKMHKSKGIDLKPDLYNADNDLIIKGMQEAILKKKVTYDFARLMDDPTELKCSEFGSAIIENM